MGKLILSQTRIDFNSEESWATVTYESEGLSSISIYGCDRTTLSADIDVSKKKIYVHCFANYATSGTRIGTVTIKTVDDSGSTYYYQIKTYQASGFDEDYGLYFVKNTDVEVPKNGTTVVSNVSGYTGGSAYTDSITDCYVGLVQQGMNNNAITVTSSASWLTVKYNPTHGIVHFTASANTSNEERRASIVVRGIAGNISYQERLTVVQASNAIKSDEIVLSPNELSIQAIDSAQKTITISRNGTSTMAATSSNSWLHASLSGSTLIVYCDGNSGVSKRTGYVTVSADSDTKSATLKVMQYGQFDTILFPIWKDTYVTYTPVNKNKGYVSYRIEVNGKEIYRGRIYKIRGNFSVKINEVLSNYIKNNIELLSSWSYEYANDSYINGYVYVSEDDWETEDTVEKFYTWDDWSYDDTERTSLSYPINGHLTRDMYGIWTKINKSFSTDMTTEMHFDNIPRGGHTSTFGNGVYTLLMKSGSEGSRKLLVDNGNTYIFEIVNTCHRYAIYYVNKYGGWDGFLFEGKELMQDNYTIHQYQREYDNYSKANRGKIQYQKDVKQTWQLNTGYLKDYESERMDNLIGTTQAYLHDLKTGEIRAVNITDTKMDYKTFKNQGRKYFNYTVNLEASDWARFRK